jgi:hypothetical protein
MSAGPLTLDQRARRAATRKNNQIARRYPLFAAEFATTAEAERERILRQQEQGRRVIERLAQHGLAQWEKGQEMRRIAQQLVPADVFAAKDAHFQQWHGHKPPEQSGGNLADIWWCALRDYAPDVAEQYR